MDESYRRLCVDRIQQTNRILCARIHERFPTASLGRVCEDLNCLIDALKVTADKIARPDWKILSLMLLIAALVIMFIGFYSFYPVVELLSGHDTIKFLEPSASKYDPGNFLQAIEAVLSGAAIVVLLLLYLFRFEQDRYRRKRALAAIHELRAMAHVVDMHQLTKDPSYVFNRAERTASSPERNLDEFELARYLNYCSEMLAIIGKLAAYYAQNFNDSVFYDAVHDVESLTNDLARKIWQKIAVLHQHQRSVEALPTESASGTP